METGDTNTEAASATSQTSAAGTGEAGKGAASDAGKAADAGAQKTGGTFVTGAAAATKDTGDGKDAKAGAAGEKKPDAQTSAAFELKSPKGVDFDKEQLGAFGTWAKEKGFNAQQAQAAVDWLGEQRAAEKKAFDANVEAANAKNLERLRADKELGGANFKQTQLLVAKVSTKYFPEGSYVSRLLDETRLGNDPEVVRVFAAIGRDMAEDTTARGSSRNKAPASKSPIRYPSMEKEQ